MQVALLTVSDRCSKGEAEDRSGPALARIVQERLGASILHAACEPDEPDAIQRRIRTWIEDARTPDLILTTGGTGLGPRDTTPEAAGAMIEREAPGLVELMRSRGGTHTPMAYLSRGVAGAIGRTLVITLPGSERGARESLEALLDVLPHAVAQLRGENDGH